MAWMASVRTASARATIASSSLSSPVTICRLKVLISANSACICSAIFWVSCLEFAMEASSAWMSSLVVRTFCGQINVSPLYEELLCGYGNAGFMTEPKLGLQSHENHFR